MGAGATKEAKKNTVKRLILIAAAALSISGSLAAKAQTAAPTAPTETYKAVLALSAAAPKRRYMVVPEQREAEITIRKQIGQLVQLKKASRTPTIAMRW
jgi:hypothetical protein